MRIFEIVCSSQATQVRAAHCGGGGGQSEAGGGPAAHLSGLYSGGSSAATATSELAARCVLLKLGRRRRLFRRRAARERFLLGRRESLWPSRLELPERLELCRSPCQGPSGGLQRAGGRAGGESETVKLFGCSLATLLCGRSRKLPKQIPFVERERKSFASNLRAHSR